VRGKMNKGGRRESVSGVLLKQTRNRNVSTCSQSEVSTRSSGAFSESVNDSYKVLDDALMCIKNISSEVNPEEMANKIIEETCNLLKADRSTLFFVDAEAGELILVIAKGANNIHIPIGKGIAGTVASTGETLNISDAYSDDRFDSSFDKESGFKTKSILATPVREPNGDLVAVLQCINKEEEGKFSKLDEVLMEHIAAHVGVALRNVKLYESERESKAKISALLEVIRMLHKGSGNSSTNSLIFTLSNRSHDLVNADRATLYLVDRPSKQLAVMQGDIDFRFPMDKGIVGTCVTDKAVVNIEDAYSDERFSQAMDKKTGYVTKTILCVPIYAPVSVLPESHVEDANEDQQLIGVLQLINKDDGEVFTEEDVQLISTLLTVAGPILALNKFFKQPPRHQSGVDDAMTALSPTASTPTGHRHTSSMSAFAEEEEEEEEG